MLTNAEIADPQNWLRGEITGTMVAVMDHYRLDRGMALEAWRTRAIKRGEIHELVISPVVSTSGIVEEIYYVGFVEFNRGILAIGDEVFIKGIRCGELVGFDSSHMPNHLNIILISSVKTTGVKLGLRVDDTVEFRPEKKATNR